MWKVEVWELGGWADAGWTDEYDDRSVPVRFETREDAEAAIAEFIAETEEAERCGDMKAHSRSDYRAVEAT